ncbi:methyl-accepting chemotaxis protein [Pyxidicoccus sp. 3LFB2]
MGFSRVPTPPAVSDTSSTHAPPARYRPGGSSRLAAFGTVLLLVLALTPLAHAASPQAAESALGGWRYRWGDSPLGTDGRPVWAQQTGTEEGWQPVAALQVPPGRGTNTMLWLSIPVPAGTWQDPALYLGNVSNAFEAYAGGQRIFSSGTLNPSGREVMDNMSWQVLPLSPTTTGQRVLLRIQGTGAAIGVTRDARVGSRHELISEVTRTGLAPFVMGTLLLTIAVVAAGTAILRRQRRMLVGLTVFAAGSGVLLLGMSGLFLSLWAHTSIGSRLSLLGGYCLLPGLAWFISDTIGEGKLRWFRIGAAVVSVPAVVQGVLVFVDLGLAQRLLLFLSSYSMPGLMVCLGIAAIEAWRGNPDARIFVSGLGVLMLALIHSTLPLLGLMETADSLMHWGFLALTLSLVGIVGRRSAIVVRSLTLHTRKLEERRQEVHTLAENMGSGAGELATVAQQLSAASEEQTAGISRQATALQQLEQTVEEIRQGSHVTADKAHLLASAAQGAEQVGRDGVAAIERTLSNLETIRAEVSEMASRILALDARTREVSGIVDAVKTLADQSNMLAINAAIEAVRNGDSGKGFAVVAREMRSLADQSIQATTRIRDVLDGLSTSMRDTAKLSEQGEQRVRGSLDAVRTSGSQLQKLASIIGETSTSVRQITAAVAQQDAGTHQIAQAIQELSGQMQRTLRVVDETKTVTRSVQSLAERMSGVSDQALRSGMLDASPVPAR